MKRYGTKILVGIMMAMVVVVYFRTSNNEPVGDLRISSINDYHAGLSNSLTKTIFPDHEPKEIQEEPTKTVIALEFWGDKHASRSKYLTTDVTTILSSPVKVDEVVVSIESTGGALHEYGYATSQLERLNRAGIDLTVCIDKVAASGGYMMASTADKILAAPFAIVGSIGVVAEVPNFNKLLKKHGVEFDVVTSGQYKRTVTMLGENTEQGRAKLQQDLVDVHGMFKEFITQNREGIDINKVANGDIWYGKEAVAMGLIDEVSTCDQYLMQQTEVAKVYKFERKGVSTIGQAITASVSDGIAKGIQAIFQNMIQSDIPVSN